MTIRTRMTLWYASILLVSLLLIAGFSLNQLRLRQREAQKEAELQRKMNRDSAMDWDDQVDSGSGINWEDVVDLALWIGVPGALLSVGGGWWLMRKSLAPVTVLTQKAERIHDHNLHEQLARSGNGDELDRLTEVFNAMTARLDGSFQRIREFTLHASHELKTPLTILHGEIETALAEEPLTEAQCERLASQLDEIQRLTKIVDGLTLLTKADAGQVELKSEPLQLDEIVRDIFADAQILARPANLTMSLAECAPCAIHGDRHRLRQLLLNLADNAVKYNQPGGAIEFTLSRAGSNAVLKVSNTGAGIAPHVLPRVFERFFRGDTSHNSAKDGCGLGLSIAKWIASTHGGKIQINSEPSRLTTVTLHLPLSPEHKVR